jgi:hypothetical protein
MTAASIMASASRQPAQLLVKLASLCTAKVVISRTKDGGGRGIMTRLIRKNTATLLQVATSAPLACGFAFQSVQPIL